MARLEGEISTRERAYVDHMAARDREIQLQEITWQEREAEMSKEIKRLSKHDPDEVICLRAELETVKYLLQMSEEAHAHPASPHNIAVNIAAESQARAETDKRRASQMLRRCLGREIEAP